MTKFFGEDTRKTSPTDFLATLNRLLIIYGEAVEKVSSNPKKYKAIIRTEPKRKKEDDDLKPRSRTDSHLPDEEEVAGDTAVKDGGFTARTARRSKTLQPEVVAVLESEPREKAGTEDHTPEGA